jgi:site-specific DNA-cytosine methylase
MKVLSLFDGISGARQALKCCRLQGFPDNYVSMVSNTQGYKALGNSFTVPVIKHIIKQLNK